jgi:hypothetical protein
VIVSSITRDGANQSYAASGPPSAISCRAPSRFPATTTIPTAASPAPIAPGAPRAAAQSVAPTVKTAVAVRARISATARL